MRPATVTGTRPVPTQTHRPRWRAGPQLSGYQMPNFPAVTLHGSEDRLEPFRAVIRSLRIYVPLYLGTSPILSKCVRCNRSETHVHPNLRVYLSGLPASDSGDRPDARRDAVERVSDLWSIGCRRSLRNVTPDAFDSPRHIRGESRPDRIGAERPLVPFNTFWEWLFIWRRCVFLRHE